VPYDNVENDFRDDIHSRKFVLLEIVEGARELVSGFLLGLGRGRILLLQRVSLSHSGPCRVRVMEGANGCLLHLQPSGMWVMEEWVFPDEGMVGVVLRNQMCPNMRIHRFSRKLCHVVY
jgi:hypothetical protein